MECSEIHAGNFQAMCRNSFTHGLQRRMYNTLTSTCETRVSVFRANSDSCTERVHVSTLALSFSFSSSLNIYADWFQMMCPSSPSLTSPLATSSKAVGKARCSASRIRSDRLSSVSLVRMGTASCTMMAPASTSSCYGYKIHQIYILYFYYHLPKEDLRYRYYDTLMDNNSCLTVRFK